MLCSGLLSLLHQHDKLSGETLTSVQWRNAQFLLKLYVYESFQLQLKTKKNDYLIMIKNKPCRVFKAYII